MKYYISSLLGLLTLLCIISCEKDEGKLPAISFKTGAGFVSKDTSITKGTPIMIGISANKTENEDVLKKFNISRSTKMATDSAFSSSVSVFSKDLTGGEGDNYSYDFNTIADTVIGQQSKYVFTISNRDGLVNQVSLTVAAK